MRRTAVIVIALLLLLALSGCGVKDKVTEGIIENIAGDDVDVDLDEGSIKFKDDEGAETTIGGAKWPKDGAGALIPVFKKGEIHSVKNSDEEFGITLLNVKLADFDQYVKELKKAGFTDSIEEYTHENAKQFSAHRGDGQKVAVSYASDNDTITIVLLLFSE